MGKQPLFVEIQELLPVHAPAVAEIHIESQPGTFLTSLGREFLTALYAQIASFSLGFGHVALLDGKVVGFVAATEDTGQLFKEMARRRWIHLIWPLFKSVSRSPALLRHIFQTLRYPGLEKGGDSAELLSIGVRKVFRSRGIGGRLMEALLEECRARAIYALDVTVDAANEGAIRFYRRHGFHHRRTFTLYGREMHSYGLSLGDIFGY
ncbi:MAG: GNAT family N-acetyltransferase [Anaerolineae bacterium]